MNCQRCAGCLIQNYDDFFCINCGNRPAQVLRPAPVVPRENFSKACLCGQSKQASKLMCWKCRLKCRTRVKKTKEVAA